MAIIDADGRVLMINDCFIKWFNITHKPVPGTDFYNWIQTLGDAGEHGCLKTLAAHLQSPHDKKIAVDHPTLEWVSSRYAEWVSEKPETAIRAWTIRDLTAEHRQQKSLETAMRDIENKRFEFERRYQEIEHAQRDAEALKHDIMEANRLKSEFLANMSHELRTPLNSIMALSSILLARMDGDLTEEQEKQITIIERSGKNLLRLINDILDISKIEAGRMDLIFAEYDVQEFLENIRMTIQPLVKESNLDFIIEKDPGVEVHSTDENKLRQILLNLLSNAVKFTPSGEVRLLVKQTKFEDVLEFQVIDTGIGIEPTHFETIFDPFRQLDGSATRKYGGTGLGLAITKKLVELLGGRIYVESEMGKGSNFRFFLPSKKRGESATILSENEIEEMMYPGKNREQDEQAASSGSFQRDAAKKLIMMVDDDPESIYIIKKYLDGHDYQTMEAHDGDEAVELGTQYLPDVILLDIMMPRKDGWMVLQELKRQPETKNIPIIILSIVDNKKLGFSLGASDYIVKPISKDVLIKRVHKLCEEKDLKKILIVDDDLTQAELVEEILASDDYISEVATSGEMAIQLTRHKVFDLIILDLLMPQVDGFAVLENLRQDPTSNRIPVLILTGKLLTQEDQQKLSGKNYHLFLKSMFSREKLLEQIHRILGDASS